MASYFSIVVINPEDWEQFLDSRDSLPATMTFDPGGTQKPSFGGGANATLQEFYLKSGSGCPATGAVSIIIMIDTIDVKGVEHRQTLLYVGRIIGGEAFRYDNAAFPIRTTLY